MKWDSTRIEILVLVILSVLFPFLITNYSNSLGSFYSILSVISIGYLLLDSKRDIQFKNPSNSWITSALIALVAIGLFLVLSNLIIIPGTQSVLKLLGASSPILSNNVLINKIVFGILVPIGETLFFFVYLFDLLASLFNIEINKQNLKNPKLWLLIVSIAFVFMFYHLQAKLAGVPLEQAVPILVVVWFMAIFSLLLVTWFKEAVQAILFHCGLNSLAIGLIPFAILNSMGLVS